MPDISCITVCRNDLEGLKKTVASALGQTQPIYELIVVDGASTDGTPEILPEIKKECEEKNIRYVAVSEPDSGIYNAMNKGVSLASGEWLIFMNAGDSFAGEKVIEDVFSCREYDDADIVYCDYIIKINNMIGSRKCLPLDRITQSWIGCHQAIFTRTECFRNRGYQEEFRLCADYEWYLHCYLNGGRFSYCPVEACISDRGGVSSSKMYRCYLETAEVQEKNGVGRPRWKVKLRKPYEWLYGSCYVLFLKLTSGMKKTRKI